MNLIGSGRGAKAEGLELLPGKTSYITARDRSRWVTNVPNFAKVSYRDVYPGIDLIYYGKQQQLEYDFVVAPGADPRPIRLAFDGVSDFLVSNTGDLVISSGKVRVALQRPIVYQEKDGRRLPVAAGYRVHPDRTVSFELGRYDASRALVIDPVLQYAAYVNAGGEPGIFGIGVDSAGNTYISGGVREPSVFPTTPGAFQTDPDNVCFVQKLDATGANLLYSTFLGYYPAYCSALAVDPSGHAYVTGDGYIPTTPGAYREQAQYSEPVFVAKLNLDGSELVYSTFVAESGQGPRGGSIVASPSIALDVAGNAYVVGRIGGENSYLQTTPGAFQTALNTSGTSIADAFVAKVNSSGTELLYATFLGGAGYEYPMAIAVDSAGHAYLTGSTSSDSFSQPLDFPTTPGAFRSCRTRNDWFVTKLDPNGGSLVYSTCLGGPTSCAYVSPSAIAVDSAGHAYLGGAASCGFFPTPGAYQTAQAGENDDAMIVKLNPNGTGVVYATYLGGTDGESVLAIQVDAAGNAYVAGLTGSQDFPTMASVRPRVEGYWDIFAAKFNAAGSALVYSTFLGGGPGNTPLAIDSAGSAYVAGFSSVPDLATPGTVAIDAPANGGGTFVAKITDAEPQAPPTVAPDSSNVSANEGSTATNAGTYSDPNSNDDVTIVASLGTVTKTGNNSGAWTWTFDTTDGPVQSQTVTITANDGNGGVTSTTFDLVVGNVLPAVNTPGLTATAIDENGTVTLTGSFVDPGRADTFVVTINWGDGSAPSILTMGASTSVLKTFSATHTYLDDNPTGTGADVNAITVTVVDKDGGLGSSGTAITVNNVAPVIGEVTGPSGPLPAGSTVSVTAAFTDPGSQDTHTCTFVWDDGGPTTTVAASGSSCTATRTFAAPGVYSVVVTVTDDDTSSGADIASAQLVDNPSTTLALLLVVIYDATGGFVTGGGWIDSPLGAYQPAPTLTGKAHFGFVSRYQPGATLPTGRTEFQFRVAGFSFQSTTYEWLVVAGHKAQFKGSGTVNGSGDYGFLLTATDGQLPGGGGIDKFRIKIWNKGNGGVVYDNVAGAGDDIDGASPQQLGGGSIVIHKQ